MKTLVLEGNDFIGSQLVGRLLSSGGIVYGVPEFIPVAEDLLV